ncbi:MAG: ImmA/IrrE family metallo-endopeptidase [Clostridia bacterium]|nr:ImmA/IrrE family metallo-endopeptidase [Clostridia bacterium]
MELNKLYDVAAKENISIIDFRMKNKAIIELIDKEYYIGLNYSKIVHSTEEKELLAEELGHYYTNTLYNHNYSNEEIRKREYRANKWKLKALVPYSKLKELYEKGIRCTYEFAEELGVSENLINTAYNYYKEDLCLEELVI